MKAILRNLQARLDRKALDQLRETAARQAEEIEQLKAELERANQIAASADAIADSWREDFYRLEEQLGAGQHVAMTPDGALHLVGGPQ